MYRGWSLGLGMFPCVYDLIWADEPSSLGAKIFQNACADCHDGGFWGWLSIAPSIKDALEWHPYLEKDVKKSSRLPSRAPMGGWVLKENVMNAPRKKSEKLPNTCCPKWRNDDFLPNSIEKNVSNCGLDRD